MNYIMTFDLNDFLILVVDACNTKSSGYIIPNRNINGINSTLLLLSPGESFICGYFVESASYKNPVSHSQERADIS